MYLEANGDNGLFNRLLLLLVVVGVVNSFHKHYPAVYVGGDNVFQ